jgi:hypothetical protein
MEEHVAWHSLVMLLWCGNIAFTRTTLVLRKEMCLCGAAAGGGHCLFGNGDKGA